VPDRVFLVSSRTVSSDKIEMAAFQSFWHGELSPYEILAMKSFVDHGHQYILYSYQGVSVPDGVVVRDAREILPENRVFYYTAGPGRGSIAGFTNLFRYTLLLHHGGWWIDADVICLKDQIFEPDVFLGEEETEAVGSAILRFPSRHPFMRAMHEAAEAAGSNIAWGATGPRLLTQSFARWGLSEYVLPRHRSYPIRAQDALHVVIPSKVDEVRTAVADASFLHMWNEIFRRAVVLKRVAPPSNSYLAEVFKAHNVTFDTRLAYTGEEVERLNANFQASLRGPTVAGS
jgi:Glycosyltransferase sugar-binding region containing DXD motif